MADEVTHRRIAYSNRDTMDRLIDPNITGGVSSEGDNPWIVVIAFYSAFHLIEEAIAVADPDSHFDNPDEQMDFIASITSLQKIRQPYNELNLLHKYALHRKAANNIQSTESKILGYGDQSHFIDFVKSRLDAIQSCVESHKKRATSIQCE